MSFIVDFSKVTETGVPGQSFLYNVVASYDSGIIEVEVHGKLFCVFALPLKEQDTYLYAVVKSQDWEIANLGRFECILPHHAKFFTFQDIDPEALKLFLEKFGDRLPDNACLQIYNSSDPLVYHNFHEDHNLFFYTEGEHQDILAFLNEKREKALQFSEARRWSALVDVQKRLTDTFAKFLSQCNDYTLKLYEVSKDSDRFSWIEKCLENVRNDFPLIDVINVNRSGLNIELVSDFPLSLHIPQEIEVEGVEILLKKIPLWPIQWVIKANGSFNTEILNTPRNYGYSFAHPHIRNEACLIYEHRAILKSWLKDEEHFMRAVLSIIQYTSTYTPEDEWGRGWSNMVEMFHYHLLQMMRELEYKPTAFIKWLEAEYEGFLVVTNRDKFIKVSRKEKKKREEKVSD